MSKNELFIYATRNKLRFPFKGMISVEDLWELSLENLDIIYKALNKQMKQYEEESLLAENSSVDAALEVQIEIVKYIVAVKLHEKEIAEKAVEKKIQKQKIMSIIAAKENEELQKASLEDLKKMLEKLNQ